MIATRAILVTTALLIGTSAPVAAESQEEAAALFDQLTTDYAQCFGYHMLAKQCAPETATASELDQLEGMANRANEGAVTAGTAIGLTTEALAERLKTSMEQQAELMGNSCAGFSALIEKYADFCRDIELGPMRRAQELREQSGEP